MNVGLIQVKADFARAQSHIFLQAPFSKTESHWVLEPIHTSRHPYLNTLGKLSEIPHKERENQ